MIEIACVVDAKALLGEGTYWDSKAQCLWWLDLYGKAIHRFDPASGRDETFATPETPGCLAARDRGGLILSMTSGFYFFDPDAEVFDPIMDPESHLHSTRFNDGKTDRQGRFWSGTTFDVPGQLPQKIGSLYRLDADLSCHRVVEGLGISNGLAFSPDSHTMYLADSCTPYVWAFDFDARSGQAENRRIFIDLSATDGICDGATIDVNGCYWLTLPFKGRVQCYDPTGQLMLTIEMPTDAPTCCEFGGKDLDILYVTTATLRRSAKELQGQPLAGGLFAIDAGVRGLGSCSFKG